MKLVFARTSVSRLFNLRRDTETMNRDKRSNLYCGAFNCFAWVVDLEVRVILNYGFLFT